MPGVRELRPEQLRRPQGEQRHGGLERGAHSERVDRRAVQREGQGERH
jgi:hypothetical protein